MKVKFDFSDVDAFLEEARREVCRKVAEIGDEAVEYAKENGNYEDRTGRLRASNEAEVGEDGSLTLRNTAEYASAVESKGYEVLSSAALYAQRRLNEEFPP